MSASLRTNGHPALRIERRLKHPPERVWPAITEPAQLSQWYPFPASAVEPRAGGRIRFDAGPAGTVDAVVTEAEPPRVFAFRVPAGDFMPGGREGENEIRIELRPEPGDGCLLIFTHTFVDLPAAASYAAGWQSCLDALELVADGRPAGVADVPAGTVRWELSEGQGGARVVLTQTGPPELADRALDAGRDRIQQLLERLRAT